MDRKTTGRKSRLKSGDNLILARLPKGALQENNIPLGPLGLPDAEASVTNLSSSVDLGSTPVSRSEAKKRARALLERGRVSFTKHARRRMAERKMDTGDVQNVVRCGFINNEGEIVDGTVRYRVETQRMFVVVAFRGENELVIVTAGRKP